MSGSLYFTVKNGNLRIWLHFKVLAKWLLHIPYLHWIYTYIHLNMINLSNWKQELQWNQFLSRSLFLDSKLWITKTIIPAFIDSVTCCILPNNCKMKSMVNVETFMLAQLEHLSSCIMQKKPMYVTSCAKSDFFCHKQKATVMFTATVSQDWVVCFCWQPNPTD